jgi:hypothetical protein
MGAKNVGVKAINDERLRLRQNQDQKAPRIQIYASVSARSISPLVAPL